MDIQSSQTVMLPDGTPVESPTTQKGWWTQQDGYGYVDPSQIAPDPNQPRTYIEPDRLAELQASVAATGVRQNLTVTPRHLAPWIKLPEGEKAFFVAVSGHRRLDAALSAGLPAVPVTVKIYNSYKDLKLDRSILNKGRLDLSEFEEGREFLDLSQSGYTNVEIATKFGIHPNQVALRINLTKLHPDIQKLIHPELAKKSRLPIITAEALGGLRPPSSEELQRFQDIFEEIIRENDAYCSEFTEMNEDKRRFSFQKMLVAVILQRGMNATRSVEFIREHTGRSSTHGTPSKLERYQPRKRRELLDTLIRQILESVVVDWKPQEFERIFNNSSREEVEEVISKMGVAQSYLIGFREILERIRDKKTVTSLEVIDLLKKKR